MLPLLLSIFSLFFFRKSSRAFTINIKGAEQALVTLIFFVLLFLIKDDFLTATARGETKSYTDICFQELGRLYC